MKLTLITTRWITAITMACSLGAAHASVINHENWLTDNVTGLDWLHFDQTRDLLYEEVNTELRAGGTLTGWQRAGDNQVFELLANATGKDLSRVSLGLSIGFDDLSIADVLFSLDGSHSVITSSSGFSADIRPYTSRGGECYEYYPCALPGHMIFLIDYRFDGSGGGVNIITGGEGRFIEPGKPSFLVRVPESSSLLLLTLGLAGLALSRRSQTGNRPLSLR